MKTIKSELIIELTDKQIKNIKKEIYFYGIGFLPDRNKYNSIYIITKKDVIDFVQNYLLKYEY